MYSLHCYPMWGNPPSSKSASTSKGNRKTKLIRAWKKIINNWDANDVELVQDAQSLVRRYPIPKQYRTEAWYLISGGFELHTNNPGVFTSLHSRPSESDDRIEKDLLRTFTNEKYKKGAENYLRSILVGYANLDESLGYCQGMNYVAGFLLNQFWENHETISSGILEKIFWTFVSVLKKVRSLFMDGLPGFHASAKCFIKLCSHHLPSLHSHFNKLNIYNLILTPWFHSLFAYPTMSTSITSRIWDLFLLHDFSILGRIAFAMVAINQKYLLKCDFVETLDFCKELSFMNNGGYNVIDKSLTLKLNKKYIKCLKDLTKFEKYKKTTYKKKEYTDLKKLHKINGKIFEVESKEKDENISQTLSQSTTTLFSEPSFNDLKYISSEKVSLTFPTNSCSQISTTSSTTSNTNSADVDELVFVQDLNKDDDDNISFISDHV